MLTQCPECKTLVDIGETKPRADESATCDHCGHEFVVRFVLSGEPAAQAAEPAAAEAPRSPYRINVSPEEMLDQRPHGHESGAEAPAARPPRAAATAAWALASLALIVALAGQYTYFMRADLARHPQLRPLPAQLCAYIDCEIPLIHAPAQMEIVGRDIRRHPEVDNALVVSVTLRNQAQYRQAYPWLEVSFYDIAQRPVARRRFSPEEYLPENIEVDRGIDPHKPVQTTLEIVDPGASAVNFEFRLL